MALSEYYGMFAAIGGAVCFEIIDYNIRKMVYLLSSVKSEK